MDVRCRLCHLEIAWLLKENGRQNWEMVSFEVWCNVCIAVLSFRLNLPEVNNRPWSVRVNLPCLWLPIKLIWEKDRTMQTIQWNCIEITRGINCFHLLFFTCYKHGLHLTCRSTSRNWTQGCDYPPAVEILSVFSTCRIQCQNGWHHSLLYPRWPAKRCLSGLLAFVVSLWVIPEKDEEEDVNVSDTFCNIICKEQQ